MKQILIFLTFIFYTLSYPIVSLAQGVQQKTVITTGIGKTEKDAIQDALVAAVSQVRGQAIKSNEVLSTQYKASNNTDNSTVDLKTNIKTLTKGVVNSFDILESQKTKEGLYQVKIQAAIPFYEAGEQIHRLRLAVIPIKVSNKVNNKQAADKYGEDWINRLEEGLVQSRRFAMLDRKYTDDTNQEVNQYLNNDFKIEELARLGQRVGTDYLVISEVRKYNVADKSVVDPLDGTKISRSSTNTEVSIRLVDVATSQIKYAKSYVDSRGAILDIINAIYPIAILAVNTNTVTLGSGGDEIKVGQRYTVMGLGKKLIDPYTNESLGKEEIPLGEIEITDVQAKTTLAKITKGAPDINKQFPQGLIIRPLNKALIPGNLKAKSSSGASPDNKTKADPDANW
jgi:curli biogenesis system outer membrane secretion channel CsgG